MIYIRLKKLLHWLYIITAHFLIFIGQQMLGKKERHQVITHLIEELFTSIDVYIQVLDISEYPLYVRFTIRIDSASEHIVNWKYFTLELVYQLGCMLSDVTIEHDPQSKKDEPRFFIDITLTAITNLEKGMSTNRPLLFEDENTMTIIKKAVNLIESGDNITPHLLKKKLNINEFRAAKLFEQLQQSGLLDKKNPKLVVN